MGGGGVVRERWEARERGGEKGAREKGGGGERKGEGHRERVRERELRT